MAPIDIIINIIDRHISEEVFENYSEEFPDTEEARVYVSGRKEALQDLKKELEGFIKLFN